MQKQMERLPEQEVADVPVCADQFIARLFIQLTGLLVSLGNVQIKILKSPGLGDVLTALE